MQTQLVITETHEHGPIRRESTSIPSVESQSPKLFAQFFCVPRTTAQLERELLVPPMESEKPL
ncbi:MAG: hypothetical protein ABR582_15750 [Gemmatimonadaceae bacterium]